MQYLSSSTIRWRPRTWPSMRRSRLRWAALLSWYPCCSVTGPVYPWGVCVVSRPMMRVFSAEMVRMTRVWG